MKTKFLLIVLFFVAFNLTTDAQIKWGIRAGISSSNMKLDKISNNGYTLEYNKGNYGWHAGLIGKIKVLKLFVQPELLYSTSNVDISYSSSGSNKEYGSQKFQKIDLPVMVGFKVAIFKLQVGPVGTLMLNSKSKLLDKNNVDQNVQGATIGFQAGIGVELTSLLLDFKYEGNLSKLGSGMNVDGTNVNFDQRMHQFIFSVGYLF
jgi:hypothetical protein